MADITRAFEGEDVPLRVAYVDDSDAGTAADDPPTVTITDPDDSAVIDEEAMSDVGDAGEYEYVWDTASDFGVVGTYTVEVEAEFDSETKINRRTISIE